MLLSLFYGSGLVEWNFPFSGSSHARKFQATGWMGTRTRAECRSWCLNIHCAKSFVLLEKALHVAFVVEINFLSPQVSFADLIETEMKKNEIFTSLFVSLFASLKLNFEDLLENLLELNVCVISKAMKSVRLRFVYVCFQCNKQLMIAEKRRTLVERETNELMCWWKQFVNSFFHFSR